MRFAETANTSVQVRACSTMCNIVVPRSAPYSYILKQYRHGRSWMVVDECSTRLSCDRSFVSEAHTVTSFSLRTVNAHVSAASRRLPGSTERLSVEGQAVQCPGGQKAREHSKTLGLARGWCVGGSRLGMPMHCPRDGRWLRKLARCIAVNRRTLI